MQKDCECKAQRVLERRLKNAMIPEEFTDARFDSYKRETEEQKSFLYNTMGKYLQILKKSRNQNKIAWASSQHLESYELSN